MKCVRLKVDDLSEIKQMSKIATEIVKDYYDPIIGPTQNDYMLARFQSVEAIKEQLKQGYRYYFIKEGEKDLGFIAFYPKDNFMYLSKFYLYKNERGHGYGRQVFDFLVNETRSEGLSRIELNVNKNNETCRIYESLGLVKCRDEKNDIGNGFYMDDYVYAYNL